MSKRNRKGTEDFGADVSEVDNFKEMTEKTASVDPPGAKIASCEGYISFAEIAMEAHGRGFEVKGYALLRVPKKNEDAPVTGNSIVVANAIDSYNAKNPDSRIKWGTIQGYTGGNNKVKCVRIQDKDRVLEVLKDFTKTKSVSSGRKTFTLRSDYEDFGG